MKLYKITIEKSLYYKQPYDISIIRRGHTINNYSCIMTLFRIFKNHIAMSPKVLNK